MLCGWEGNRRSGVTLANPCGTDFSGLSTYGLRGHGQGKGDEHRTYVHSGMVRFALPYLCTPLGLYVG